MQYHGFFRRPWAEGMIEETLSFAMVLLSALLWYQWFVNIFFVISEHDILHSLFFSLVCVIVTRCLRLDTRWLLNKFAKRGAGSIDKCGEDGHTTVVLTSDRHCVQQLPNKTPSRTSTGLFTLARFQTMMIHPVGHQFYGLAPRRRVHTEPTLEPSVPLSQQQEQQQQQQQSGTMPFTAQSSHQQFSVSDEIDGGDGGQGLPTESQLVLLCLDYLRDLRRAYPAEDLKEVEGLDADYMSIAIYALSRCFLRPDQLVGDNDCMMDPSKQLPLSPRHQAAASNSQQQNWSSPAKGGTPIIPPISVINHEILYKENPHFPEDDDADQKKDDKDESDPYTWYDYDDMHPSNVHRFYPLAGLASGPSLKGPLTLGEIVAAGVAGLGARSRSEAEKDMIQSPLFEQFVQAVKSKGFFMDPDNDTPLLDPEEESQRVIRQQKNYDDRYRKVVSKFRTKLAIKAESPAKPGGTPLSPSSVSGASPIKSGNWLALTSADRQRRRREQAMEESRWRKQGGTPNTTPRRSSHQGMSSPRVLNLTLDSESGVGPYPGGSLTPRSQHADHPKDLEQAERSKAEGNVLMQKKLYSQAVQSYTQALKISPNGPHSHVYFSNRAAALLSMKKFGEAILDSERALALKPDYGKAHARLGLAHFLSGNYRQAMEAYTVSLKYDPDNASSKSYLEKAAKRMAESGSSSHLGPIQSSFSLVSEWESSQRQPQQQQQQQRQQTHHHQSHSLPTIQQQLPSSSHPASNIDSSSGDERSNQELQRDAEKFKAKGNAYMAHRDYNLALESYTSAIRCSPDGPQSHVYYSNRAAAHCYLERYRDAIADSERSLELSPTYGKAHARLGLSRFFLQDYAGAVAAYTSALEHDPDNAASKSYLAKARARLEGRSSRSSSRNSSPAPSLRQRQSFPSAHAS
jgi:tetratricopeptide (TPR) repeat protein